MKKCWILFLLAALTAGCARQETFETVADEWIQPVMASPREVSVRLPEGAVAPVLDSDSEQVYLCDDYELILETRGSGDLNGTIQALTGYAKDALTVLQTQWDDVDRYDFVWTSAGEDGDVLGRGVILDDGQYHYCMSVLRSAADTKKSQIVWSDVFQSFTLADTAA